MKMTPAMKNSEKIWRLEYWKPISNQDPDEQNKVNGVNEIRTSWHNFMVNNCLLK